MENLRVVLCTFPDLEQARQIGAALVETQVAACVNLLPGAESIYRWQDKIETGQEVLAIIKTANYPALEAAILVRHPYDTPEIIALGIENGSTKYLDWLKSASPADVTEDQIRSLLLMGCQAARLVNLRPGNTGLEGMNPRDSEQVASRLVDLFHKEGDRVLAINAANQFLMLAYDLHPVAACFVMDGLQFPASDEYMHDVCDSADLYFYHLPKRQLQGLADFTRPLHGDSPNEAVAAAHQRWQERLKNWWPPERRDPNQAR